MTQLSPTQFFKTVRDRLQLAEAWPSKVYRNRGRLALWQDVQGDDDGSRVVGNVVDGDPRYVNEMQGPLDMVEEFDQRCVVEFLAYNPDDDARSETVDAALQGLVEALLPRPSPSEARNRDLNNGVGHLRIEQLSREGVAVDSTPGISGFQLVLSAEMTGDTIAG